VSARIATYGSIAVSVAFVMELTLVPLLLPSIQQEFGLSIGELAWVFNAYGIAVAIGVLLGGWLGDVFGARTVFSFGVLFFASGSALVAMAGSYEILIAGRVIQGFGGGVFSPLIPVLLTSASPERPGKILIVWGSIVGYVAAFAPFVYSRALEAHNWSLAFSIFAAVALVALAVVLAAQSGTAVAARSRPIRDYRSLLRSRGLWLVFVYVFCTYGAISYYLFRLPILLVDGGLDVTSIGLIFSILWLSFSVMSTLLRNLVDAPSVRFILLGAPVLIGLGFPLAYYCANIWCLALASFLLGSGLAFSNAPSTQLVLQLAPRGMTAISASLDITFARLGGVATVAVLADSVFGYSVIGIAMLSIVAIVCAWLVVRIPDAHRRDEVRDFGAQRSGSR
jgi:MFS family permease